MKLVLTRQMALINEVYDELQNMIRSPYWKARERFQITCDLMTFTDAIPEVAMQKAGKAPNTYTVLMDGKFVCNFQDDLPKSGVMWLIYNNLYEMAKAGEIVFNIYEKQHREDLKKEKLKKEKLEEVKQFDALRKNANLSKLNDDEREVFQEFSDQKRKEIAK